MSATNIAGGVVLGLLSAGLTGRLVDKAMSGQEHGIHVAAAMSVPILGTFVAGASKDGTVARGALYGTLAGAALFTVFASTFNLFGPPAGFFGETSKRRVRSSMTFQRLQTAAKGL